MRLSYGVNFVQIGAIEAEIIHSEHLVSKSSAKGENGFFFRSGLGSRFALVLGNGKPDLQYFGLD